MSADYPAAHSMDTEWFAVDANGRIGIFETGEPGPVPLSAPRDKDAVETLKQLFLAAPLTFLANCRSQLAFHIAELFRVSWIRWGKDRPLPYHTAQVCVLVRSRDQLSRLSGTMEFGGEQMTADGPVLPVFIDGLDPQGYEQLHSSGACLGCINLYWLRENRPERLGIYRYGAWDNLNYGPYVKAAAPDMPLADTDVPAAVRAMIEAVRLPITFEASENVQPLEFIPCRVWGSRDDGVYLASDMQTLKPLPDSALYMADEFRNSKG